MSQAFQNQCDPCCKAGARPLAGFGKTAASVFDRLAHLGPMPPPFDNLSPDALERRYREDAIAFRAWVQAHPEWEADPAHATWQARWEADGLEETAPQPVKKTHFGYPVLIATLVALPFLIPYWMTDRFDPEWAQPWFGLLVFLPLMLWHAVRAEVNRTLTSRIAIGVALGAGFTVVIFHQTFSSWPSASSLLANIEFLDVQQVERVRLLLQTHDLMLLHAPLLMLGITGAIWTWSKNGGDRVEFIRNGLQVLIYSALIAAAGGLFTLLSTLMAMMLNVNPEPIAVHLLCWGGSGLLVFAHHVWLRQSDALKAVLPIIAGLFVPLFVLLESGFLLTYLSKGLRELTDDREELLVFNVLLVAVIGLVLLHSALQRNATRLGRTLVIVLVILGIIADLIGIAAIGTRLFTMGLTPNRIAVLVTNLLFLFTLLALVPSFLPQMRERGWPDISGVLNKALVTFVGWSAIVTLLFPAQQLWSTRDLDADAFTPMIEQVETEVAIDGEDTEDREEAEEAEATEEDAP